MSEDYTKIKRESQQEYFGLSTDILYGSARSSGKTNGLFEAIKKEIKERYGIDINRLCNSKNKED